MKRLLFALAPVAVLAGCAMTPDKPATDRPPVASAAVAKPVAGRPDFSGEWKMNLAKSDFADVPPPTGGTRKIEHHEPSLTIVDVQTGGGNPGTTTRTVTTDGKNNTCEMQGMHTACKAEWDGDGIILTTSIASFKVAISDRMSLSDDGKTLTSETLVLSPQLNTVIKIVFDRQ